MILRFLSLSLMAVSSVVALTACAEVNVPDARNVDIPAPIKAEKRQEAVNERPDSVVYLPLGEDVLVPERMTGQDLPSEVVGPFELRGETLAGALQLILADYDVSIAFETDLGLTKKVTVSNLKGPLNKVVMSVCSLADLYCSYEDGALVVKDTQTFTVSLPPLEDAEGGASYISDIIAGLSAVLGGGGTTPVSDPTTRTVIYGATQRTAKLADNYFQRLRANTAMIVFETYIWEVSLNSGNSTGIDWEAAEDFGKFRASIALNGTIDGDFASPVNIGLPQTAGATPADIINFLSRFGAVKTISQPQITVLSGAKAELRVADTQNYVSEVTSTINGDNTSTSVSTDSVDSGFTLSIGSSWDKSTVYANVNINLANVDAIEDFAFSDSGDDEGTDTIIQLPQTTERELKTQIRVRPGDSVLIGGLVRERDNFDSRGPGFMEPIIPDSRTAQTENLELVIMLRPRVVVYTGLDHPRNQKQNYTTSSPRRYAPLAKRAAPLPLTLKTEPVRPSVELPSYESAASVDVPYAAPAPLRTPVRAPDPVPPYVAPPVPVQKQVQIEEAYRPIVRQPVVAPPAPVYSKNVSPVLAPATDDVYMPSQSSGYKPGYVSGAVRSYDSRGASYTPSYSEPSVSAPSSSQLAPPVYENSYAPSGDVYSPGGSVKSPSPLSADIYNNAEKLNVYEAFDQSQQR